MYNAASSLIGSAGVLFGIIRVSILSGDSMRQVHSVGSGIEYDKRLCTLVQKAMGGH